jgi:hypothetical protein
MYQTHEVRWFMEEPIESLVNWFDKKGHNWKNIIPRTDYYLPLTALKGMGIKLREGNIEIKKLIRQSKKRTFIPNVIEGKMQHWTKSSFDLSSMDKLSNEIIREKKYDWIEVKKERMGYSYEFTATGRLTEEKSLEQEFPEGCQVEYTRITMHNTSFYTLGFEAFSNADRHKQNLAAGTKLMIKDLIDYGALRGESFPLFTLPNEKSMGYPDFLEKISYGVNLDLY